MSTVSVTNLKNAASGTNNLVLATDGSVSISGNNYSPQTGFKNRIINGAMTIDQRNAGASVTLGAGDVYTIDRWNAQEDSDGGMTAQRSTTAPAGFINSLLFTTTTADASLSATQSVWARQIIEGFNVADLAWGTANASTVTLSFWVRSSLTGTFGGSLVNSAGNRSYPFAYTISTANTFEYKTITIPGDTSGTWLTDNGRGIMLFLGLGVGSTYSGTAGAWAGSLFFSATGATSVVGTSGATFYITGVQLEKGSVATPFEFRSIGTELALCQRYLPAWNSTASSSVICTGSPYSTTAASLTFPFKVSARVPPTGISTTSAGSFSVVNSSGSYVAAGTISWGGSASTESAVFNITGASGLIAGGGTWAAGGATAQILFTGCEL
jgi:hypothetical protein